MRPIEGDQVNRFTRIGERLTAALLADPEHQAGDKMIIIMNDGVIGGTTLDGYASDSEAVIDLYSELSMICDVNGVKLVIASRESN